MSNATKPTAAAIAKPIEVSRPEEQAHDGDPFQRADGVPQCGLDAQQVTLPA